MQIIYPTEYVVLDNGCIAVWRKKSGPRRVAGIITEGRPSVFYNGQGWKCGRLSYHLNVQELPRTPETLKDGIVCHHCDNPWCINPEHLYLGTAKQNTTDMYSRNKFVKERMSESKRGNRNVRGKKWNEESRMRLSESLKGNTNKKGKKQKPMTEEQRQRRKDSWTPERKAELAKKMAGNKLRREYFAARKNHPVQA